MSRLGKCTVTSPTIYGDVIDTNNFGVPVTEGTVQFYHTYEDQGQEVTVPVGDPVYYDPDANVRSYTVVMGTQKGNFEYVLRIGTNTIDAVYTAPDGEETKAEEPLVLTLTKADLKSVNSVQTKLGLFDNRVYDGSTEPEDCFIIREKAMDLFDDSSFVFELQRNGGSYTPAKQTQFVTDENGYARRKYISLIMPETTDLP